MLILLLTLCSAFAAPGDGTFYLEGPEVASRRDALEVVREASDQGFVARVERREHHGADDAFVAVVGGFEDADSAAEAALALATRTGISVTVYSSESGEVIGEVARLGGVDGPSVEELEAPDSVSALLKRAVRAHGGSNGGIALLEGSSAQRFRFRRTTPEGLVVEHTWALRDGDRYLQVDVVKGAGTSSRTWLQDDGAWLAAADGAPTPQDKVRTAELVLRFAPQTVLSFPLTFARVIASRPDLQLLYDDGEGTVDGRSCKRLRYDGQRDTGSVALCIDTETWRVVEVTLGGEVDRVVHRYADYRDLGRGLVIPGRLRTLHGETLVDDVEVLELELAPHLPDDWFAPPAP